MFKHYFKPPPLFTTHTHMYAAISQFAYATCCASNAYYSAAVYLPSLELQSRGNCKIDAMA